MKRVFYSIFLGLFTFCYPLYSCTVFVLSNNKGIVYGQNLDWRSPISGHVIVNKRGIHKSVLHWKGRWPASKEDKRSSISWTSKYGSVTFTYLGIDFIEGGMNEVGLMVDEATYIAKYPPDDGRPGISCGQWMQYQLDNFETVDEVIEHLADLRPDGEEWHYLIADRFGNTCAIEYLDGNPTIYMNETLEFPVLTNTSYTQAMSHIPLDKAFGGEIDIASGTDSYGRFVKAAELIERFETVNDDITEYAFHILDEVGNETTRRSVVYDVGSNKVLWRSEKQPEIKWLELNQIDFAEGTPTLMIDADISSVGVINDQLIVYDYNAIRDCLFGKFKDASVETKEILKARGFTLDQALEYILRQSAPNK